MLMVDMEAENSWNKLIPFEQGTNSVNKVRCPNTVYESTLELNETSTDQAKKCTKQIWELSNSGSKTKCSVS